MPVVKIEISEEQSKRIDKKLRELALEISKVSYEIGEKYNLDYGRLAKLHHELLIKAVVHLLDNQLKVFDDALKEVVEREEKIVD
jgi:hypothetical protein